MLDIKFIRSNPILFDISTKIRGNIVCANKILDVDMLRRYIINKLQKIRKLRNRVIKKISFLKVGCFYINNLIFESDFIKSYIFYLEQKNKKI